MSTSTESFVSRYASSMPLEIRPLEFVVGEAPAGCFEGFGADFTNIENAHCVGRAYACGFTDDQLLLVGAAPLGDLSAQELIAAVSAI